MNQYHRFLLTFFIFSIALNVNILYSHTLLQTSSATSQHMVGKSMITIGRFTYTFSDLEILEFGEGASLSIGQFSSIALNVTFFLGGNHRADWITTFPFCQIYTEHFGGNDIVGHPATKGAIVIGNDVWIGRNATIMSGVTIGDGAIVGAYAVVAKNVAPYSIVVGNPAKHIKYRFDEDICAALQKLKWWDLEIDQIKEIVHELCDCPDLEKLNFWLQKYRSGQ